MNPEDLLLSALSACHMLWYLHYASDVGIVVTSYSDSPLGVGGWPGWCGAVCEGHASSAYRGTGGADLAKAEAIHHRIHESASLPGR